MPGKGIGDCHTHHMKHDYIPDIISLQQTSYKESWLKSIGRLWASKQEKKFIRLLRSKRISTITDSQITEMNNCLGDGAQLDYSLVLLLDYHCSAIIGRYERFTRYETQLEQVAESCARYPFRFFLFHFFDPRRMDNDDIKYGTGGGRKTYAMRLLEKAYYQYGIVGIKMYPALGYHPRSEMNTSVKCIDHEVQYNEFYDDYEFDEVEEDFELEDFVRELKEYEVDVVRENLKYLYQFSKEHHLPITSHCGSGGSYLCTVREHDMESIWKLSQPKNYMKIAEDYGLRINLAHMGGKTDLPREMEQAAAWKNQIIDMMKTADSWTHSRGRIYADQSFDINHVLKDPVKLQPHIDDTARLLDDPVVGKYLLFGSDWPLYYCTCDKKDYIEKYWHALNLQQRSRYFSDNIATFLFGDSRQVPENYIDFIKSQHHGQIPAPEPWIREENGKYYLV